MTRKELYALVQENHLQNTIKERFGKNYTLVGNDDLQRAIWDFDATLVDEVPDEEESIEEVETEELEDTDGAEETSKQEPMEVDNPYKAACLGFLSILDSQGILDNLLDELHY